MLEDVLIVSRRFVVHWPGRMVSTRSRLPRHKM